MTDLIDLLSEVSLSLKVGWILWFSGGLALAAWFRIARTTPVPVALPLPSRPIVRPPAQQKDPWDLGDSPAVEFSAESEGSLEVQERPTKKSRRLRRTTD